jgi:class 3 adenylate cyclase
MPTPQCRCSGGRATVGSSGPHTRGFLFADLRGYSAYTEAHGDEAATNLIHRYRALVRSAIAGYDGAEIRTEGDSFYVVFVSVSQAVRAGLAIRDAAARASSESGAPPIRVGIGIHAGEVEDGAEGIVSSAVNIAARVCAIARAGEVLVTDTVRSLTRTLLPIAFEPRGRRRLKGITEPVPLYAVVVARDQSVGTGRRRSTVALTIAGLVVATAIVATGLATMRGDRTASVSSPSASEAIDGIAPSGSLAEIPFPNEAEARLLDRLPAAVAGRCTRADPKDVPVSTDVAFGRVQEFPLPVVAGVSCLDEVNRVNYWHSSSEGQADSVFFHEVGRRRVGSGTCEAPAREYANWRVGSFSGRVLCWSSATRPELWWTYDDEPIIAVATRLDGDLEALLTWWREIGRFLRD